MPQSPDPWREREREREREKNEKREKQRERERKSALRLESAVYIFCRDLKVAVYPSSPLPCSLSLSPSLPLSHSVRSLPLALPLSSGSGQISPTVVSAVLCGGVFMLEPGLPSGSLHLSKHPPGRCAVFPASHSLSPSLPLSLSLSIALPFSPSLSFCCSVPLSVCTMEECREKESERERSGRRRGREREREMKKRGLGVGGVERRGGFFHMDTFRLASSISCSVSFWA